MEPKGLRGATAPSRELWTDFSQALMSSRGDLAEGGREEKEGSTSGEGFLA